jgi:hypothetical protein
MAFSQSAVGSLVSDNAEHFRQTVLSVPASDALIFSLVYDKS